MEHKMEENMSLEDDETSLHKDMQIVFVTKDDVEFMLTHRQCALVGLVKEALSHENDPPEVLKLTIDLDSTVFCHVMNWLVHHDGTAPPRIERPLSDDTSIQVFGDWDGKFIDDIASDIKMLEQVILASNYLNIARLLDLSCARMAMKWMKYSPNNLSKYLGTDTLDEKKQQLIK